MGKILVGLAALLCQLGMAAGCAWYEAKHYEMDVTTPGTLYSGQDTSLKWQYKSCCSIAATGLGKSCSNDNGGNVDSIKLLYDDCESLIALRAPNLVPLHYSSSRLFF
jgi:hypothetical protein